MKTIFTLFVSFILAFNSFSQQIKSIPVGIANGIPVGTNSPTASEIETAYRNLIENPDTSLNHEKIRAQRWMNYVYKKYNITNGNQFSTKEYSGAVKSMYNSPLNCNGNDPANWISDGPYDIPAWLFGGSLQASGGWTDAIYANPGNVDEIIIGTRTSGIMKTTDGGVNWFSVTDNLNFPVLGVKQIIASPTNSDYLVTISGTEDIEGGVFYSSDGGDTWGEVTQNLPQFHWIDFHPVYSNILFAAADKEVMYSVNSGLTWQSIGAPAGYDDLHKSFVKIICLENKVFVTNEYLYQGISDLYEIPFTYTANSVIATWNNSQISSSFISNPLRYCDFSNKALDRFYIIMADALI